MFDVFYKLVQLAAAVAVFYLVVDWLIPKQPPKWWGKDDE